MPWPPPVTITTFSFSPSIILGSSFDLPLCDSRIPSHTIPTIPRAKHTEPTSATALVCADLVKNLLFNSQPNQRASVSRYRDDVYRAASVEIVQSFVHVS